MQVILSRKGFDSANGGVASPQFDDGSAMSLPIPGRHGPTRYRDLRSTTPACSTGVDELIEDLTGGRVKGRHVCHLDPDLCRASAAATEEWTPAFGQVGAAQSHLDNEVVKSGDLFLFFGWFRDVERHAGKWCYRPGSRSVHRLFGWLQVREKIHVGNAAATMRASRPDLQRHPHLHGWWATSNTIYTAAPTLTIPGIAAGRPGAGLFRGNRAHVLTRDDAASRSEWELPGCFLPEGKHRGLSYHRHRGQWKEHEGRARLRAVARGQEFVFDATGVTGVDTWLRSLFAEAADAPGESAGTS